MEPAKNNRQQGCQKLITEEGYRLRSENYRLHKIVKSQWFTAKSEVPA